MNESRSAQEPIHTPCSIQPHGALIVLADSDLSITHVSSNVGDFSDISAGEACGARITAIVGATNAEQLESAIRAGDLIGFNPMKMMLAARGVLSQFECTVQRARGSFIIELQPYIEPLQGFEFELASIRKPLSRLKVAPDVGGLLRDAAVAVQHIGGFDRTMVYQFHDDWHGEVVAEATSGGDVLGSYLGLHFPASDIPEQARRLYVENPLRLIGDVCYVPAALVPELDTVGKPVDLSGAILRSTSPMHLEYLRSMGVRALMSISIIEAARLWGLIACHHRQPRWPNYETRDACVLVGETLARELELRIKATDARAQEYATMQIESLTSHFCADDDLIGGLDGADQALLELFEANGLLLNTGDGVSRVATAPTDDAAVKQIVTALSATIEAGVSANDALGILVPQAAAHASGALLITLSDDADDDDHYLLLTRTEFVHTVHWGGDGQTRIHAYDGRLNPHETFAPWKETVRGHSRPWSASNIHNARLLRQKLREHRHDVQQRRYVEALRQSGEVLRQTAEALGRSEYYLRKSESFLNRTGAVAGVGGWEYDLVTGRVHWSNQTRRIAGVVSEYQPTLDQALEFFALEGRPIIKDAIRRAIELNEPWDLELPFIRKDGRRIWVRTVGAPALIEGKPFRLVGALQDVTERVDSRVALQAANERIALATDSAGIGFFEWNFTTHCLVWDANACGLFGWGPGKPAPNVEQLRGFVYPDDLANLERTAAAAIHSEKQLDTEFRIVWRDGGIHHLRVAGHLSCNSAGHRECFVGVAWDVTEPRRLVTDLARCEHALLRFTKAMATGECSGDQR